jgi:2-methylisocitrate lyase-like PEP mutase family enzyme
MTSKTQRLRELIETVEILIQPSVYGGFSARLVQQMGFKSATIRDMEQRFLTKAQLQADYGAAR